MGGEGRFCYHLDINLAVRDHGAGMKAASTLRPKAASWGCWHRRVTSGRKVCRGLKPSARVGYRVHHRQDLVERPE